MTGNWLINNDTQRVSYDFMVPVQFVGDCVLTRQHLEESLKYLDATKKEMTNFSTHQLSGIHIKDLPFNELPDLIQRVEAVLEDLKEMQGKIEAEKAQG